MATNTVSLKIDGEHLLETLVSAREQLSTAKGELLLDFAGVQRMDPAGLRLMEELVQAAEEKAVTLVLQGVNIDVYKVMKLVKLAPRVAIVHE